MNLTIATRGLAHVLIEAIWNRGELEMADALFRYDCVNHGGLISEI